MARTPSRWVCVDLHDRALEAIILARLTRPGTLEVRAADVAIAQAATALARAGLVIDCELPVVLVDGTASIELPELEVTRCSAADAARSDAGLVVLVGAPDDGELGRALDELATARRPSLVAWIDERGVAIARDDGVVRGCGLCAWSMDSALVRYVAGGELGAVPRVYADACALARIASGVLASAILDPLGPPRAGQVWTFDRRDGSAGVSTIVAHPMCVCATRPARSSAPVAEATWESLARKRQAPVWPVQRSGPERTARVIYRRSRAPWRVDQQALGVAMAAGDAAETRALAEAIERFCLLHAPPDVRHLAARELDREYLPARDVEELTFRPAEYAIEGFRFAPYSSTEPLDWSVARSLDGFRSVLVPTSLVGRVPSGSRALVDATSNGYACHLDPVPAIERAILELVERDAILLHAYAPVAPLPWIDTDLPIASTVSLLATQDIDVPVVLSLGCRLDGSLRCGSAAATTIDEALRRAATELRVALEGTAPTGAPRSLRDTSRRYEPRDHLAHHAAESGRRAFEQLTRSSTRIPLADLRRRWPATDAGSRLSRALGNRFDVWIVERSLPAVFGAGWHVVRALVPGLVELSWGLPYRRLASPRIAERLARGAMLSDEPHPIA
ncbi:MAG: YcaO-like family protein [Deltaproteobacteria bacterium]|nr:YcaO-like family protein [Deltaproteobacteria bacterium]